MTEIRGMGEGIYFGGRAVTNTRRGRVSVEPGSEGPCGGRAKGHKQRVSC